MLISRRKLNAMSASAGSDVFVSGEQSGLAKGSGGGNGACRTNIPLSYILKRMAQRVLHERPVPKVKRVKRPGNAKFTDDQVRALRRLYNAGASVTDLALIVAMGRNSMMQILDGTNYSKVL